MWSQCWEIIVKGIRSLYFSVTRERIGSRRRDKMKNERKSMRKRDGKGLQFLKRNGKETHLQSFNTKKKHLKQVLWQQHQDKTRKKALSFQKSIISPVDPREKLINWYMRKTEDISPLSYIPHTLDCVFHSWGNQEPEDCFAWLHPFLSHLDDWMPQFVQTRVSLLDEETPGSIHLLGYSVVRGMSLQWDEKSCIRRDLVLKKTDWRRHCLRKM